MSIETDILALNPVLYWPLDDPTGPAAVDASGNGHTGAYGGPFTTHAPGPEPNTFAVQLAASGSVLCTGFPQLSGAPFSAVWYASRNVIPSPASGKEVGSYNDSTRKGWWWGVANNENHTLNYYDSATSLRSQVINVTPTWNRWWHSYGLTYNGTTGWVGYLDGAAVSAPSFTSSTTLSTDQFGITAVYGLVIAHLAYFDKLLTPAQMGVLQGHRYDWPFGPMIDRAYPEAPAGGGGALSPSDPVVVDINTDLSDIRRAVIRDFPPAAP